MAKVVSSCSQLPEKKLLKFHLQNYKYRIMMVFEQNWKMNIKGKWLFLNSCNDNRV